LAQRGIDKETAEYFGVGFFSRKGSMAGRVVIPIENERGELVAYAGRSMNSSEPKYKLPAGFKKSQVLFNVCRALDEGSTGAVVLVEGFFDCMKVTQAEHVCVALMGCSLSRSKRLNSLGISAVSSSCSMAMTRGTIPQRRSPHGWHEL
jgi:DNA primase